MRIVETLPNYGLNNMAFYVRNEFRTPFTIYGRTDVDRTVSTGEEKEDFVVVGANPRAVLHA